MGRDLSKLFQFSSTIAPFNDKLSKVLAEAEQNQLKINKDETNTFKRLADVRSDI